MRFVRVGILNFPSFPTAALISRDFRSGRIARMTDPNPYIYFLYPYFMDFQ